MRFQSAILIVKPASHLPPACALALLMLLAGCGQKGPLYLPAKPAPIAPPQTPAPAAPPAPVSK